MKCSSIADAILFLERKISDQNVYVQRTALELYRSSDQQGRYISLTNHLSFPLEEYVQSNKQTSSSSQITSTPSQARLAFLLGLLGSEVKTNSDCCQLVCSVLSPLSYSNFYESYCSILWFEALCMLPHSTISSRLGLIPHLRDLHDFLKSHKHWRASFHDFP